MISTRKNHSFILDNVRISIQYEDSNDKLHVLGDKISTPRTYLMSRYKPTTALNYNFGDFFNKSPNDKNANLVINFILPANSQLTLPRYLRCYIVEQDMSTIKVKGNYVVIKKISEDNYKSVPSTIEDIKSSQPSLDKMYAASAATPTNSKRKHEVEEAGFEVRKKYKKAEQNSALQSNQQSKVTDEPAAAASAKVTTNSSPVRHKVDLTNTAVRATSFSLASPKPGPLHNAPIVASPMSRSAAAAAAAAPSSSDHVAATVVGQANFTAPVPLVNRDSSASLSSSSNAVVVEHNYTKNLGRSRLERRTFATARLRKYLEDQANPDNKGNEKIAQGRPLLNHQIKILNEILIAQEKSLAAEEKIKLLEEKIKLADSKIDISIKKLITAQQEASVMDVVEDSSAASATKSSALKSAEQENKAAMNEKLDAEELKELALKEKQFFNYVVPLITGGGKTCLFLRLAKITGLKTLIVVPTDELIDQTVAACSVDAAGAKIGKLFTHQLEKKETHAEGFPRIIEESDIIVTSYQTLQRHYKIIHGDIDAIVNDEGHQSKSDLRQEMVNHFVANGCALSFYSATPGDVFDEDDNCYSLLGYKKDGSNNPIIGIRNIKEAIAAGINCPVVTGIYSVKNAENHQLAAMDIYLNGKAPNGQAFRTMQGVIFGNNISEIRQLENGLNAVSVNEFDPGGVLRTRYAVNKQKAAQASNAKFTQQDYDKAYANFKIAAAVYSKQSGQSGNTPGLSKSTRKAIIEQARLGGIGTLLTVNALLEGFDLPSATFAIMMKTAPSKRRTLVQAAGRVLRLNKLDKNKKAVVVQIKVENLVVEPYFFLTELGRLNNVFSCGVPDSYYSENVSTADFKEIPVPNKPNYTMQWKPSGNNTVIIPPKEKTLKKEAEKKSITRKKSAPVHVEISTAYNKLNERLSLVLELFNQFRDNMNIEKVIPEKLDSMPTDPSYKKDKEEKTYRSVVKKEVMMDDGNDQDSAFSLFGKEAKDLIKEIKDELTAEAAETVSNGSASSSAAAAAAPRVSTTPSQQMLRLANKCSSLYKKINGLLIKASVNGKPADEKLAAALNQLNDSVNETNHKFGEESVAIPISATQPAMAIDQAANTSLTNTRPDLKDSFDDVGVIDRRPVRKLNEHLEVLHFYYAAEGIASSVPPGYNWTCPADYNFTIPFNNKNYIIPFTIHHIPFNQFNNFTSKVISKRDRLSVIPVYKHASRVRDLQTLPADPEKGAVFQSIEFLALSKSDFPLAFLNYVMKYFNREEDLGLEAQNDAESIKTIMEKLIPAESVPVNSSLTNVARDSKKDSNLDTRPVRRLNKHLNDLIFTYYEDTGNIGARLDERFNWTCPGDFNFTLMLNGIIHIVPFCIEGKSDQNGNEFHRRCHGQAPIYERYLNNSNNKALELKKSGSLFHSIRGLSLDKFQAKSLLKLGHYLNDQWASKPLRILRKDGTVVELPMYINTALDEIELAKELNLLAAPARVHDAQASKAESMIDKRPVKKLNEHLNEIVFHFNQWKNTLSAELDTQYNWTCPRNLIFTLTLNNKIYMMPFSFECIFKQYSVQFLRSPDYVEGVYERICRSNCPPGVLESPKAGSTFQSIQSVRLERASVQTLQAIGAYWNRERAHKLLPVDNVNGVTVYNLGHPESVLTQKNLAKELIEVTNRFNLSSSIVAQDSKADSNRDIRSTLPQTSAIGVAANAHHSAPAAVNVSQPIPQTNAPNTFLGLTAANGAGGFGLFSNSSSAAAAAAAPASAADDSIFTMSDEAFNKKFGF